MTATFLLHVHHLRFGTPKCVYGRDHVLLLILLRTFDGRHLQRACKWKSSFFMRTAKKIICFACVSSADSPFELAYKLVESNSNHKHTFYLEMKDVFSEKGCFY